VNSFGSRYWLDLYQLRRWALFAVIPALLAAALSYLYVRHQPEIYQASATLYVQQAQAGGTGVSAQTDVGGSVQLAQGYSQMISDRVIALSADRQLDRMYPGYRVEDHNVQGQAPAQAGAQPNAPVVQVTVTDTIPERAAAAANEVATAFIAYIRQLESSRFTATDQSLNRQLDIAKRNANRPGYQNTYQALIAEIAQFQVLRDAQLNNVALYSPATPPSLPTGPHPARVAALVGFLVLMLCAAAVVVNDYVKDLARTPEEVEEIAGAPILGTVPRFNVKGSQLVGARQLPSEASETYRVIRTNIQFINVDRPPRTIVVTSALPREGKTTTASNLAHVLAAGGQEVILVDGDLRRPSLHNIYSADRQQGLTVLLVTHQLNGQGLHQTDEPNLRLLAAGPVPPNPADLLGSERMKEVVAHFRERTEVVVFDSPPILAVTDAAILSTMVDGVVLVVDPSKTKRRDIRRAREAIEAVGGKILGVVLNRMSRGSGLYYYYSHYGYAQKVPQRTKGVASRA